jgi:hypothetical protein
MPVDKSNEPAKKNEPEVQQMPTGPAPTETSQQDLPVSQTKEQAEPQSYVHLSDGTVLRVKDEDLPTASGTNAPYGYWQRGNKVYDVIGVYPVEVTVEEN